jgi:hypothetical protein
MLRSKILSWCSLVLAALVLTSTVLNCLTLIVVENVFTVVMWNVKRLLCCLLLLGLILSKSNTYYMRKKKLLSTNFFVSASKVVCLKNILVIFFNMILRKLVNWKNWIMLKRRIEGKLIKNIRNPLRCLWLLHLIVFSILVLVLWSLCLLTCPPFLYQLLNNSNLMLCLEIARQCFLSILQMLLRFPSILWRWVIFPFDQILFLSINLVVIQDPINFVLDFGFNFNFLLSSIL